MTGSLNFVHNNDNLHLVSLGGEANSFSSDDIGGRLTNLKISGDAALYINGDLDDSFQDETPITIDASENTGGVDLELSGSEKVTFIGTQADDDFVVWTDGSYDDDYVNITGGAGNNHFYVDTVKATITSADGNNDIEVDAVSATVTVGDGDNRFAINAAGAVLTVGDGDNRIEVTSDEEWSTEDPDYSSEFPAQIVIVAGDGQNDIDAWQYNEDYNGRSVDITVGNGGNTIDARGNTITVNAGTGNDVIMTYGSVITINSGAGNDEITVGAVKMTTSITSASMNWVATARRTAITRNGVRTVL